MFGMLSVACAGQPFAPTTDARPAGAEGRTGSSTPRPDAPEDVSAASTALLKQSRSQRWAGDTSAAIATIERAIRIDPKNPWLWLELADLHLSNADSSRAENLAYKAMTLAQGNGAAHTASLRLIIDALYAQGREEEAREMEGRLSR